jgi:hypothetical protein
MSGGIKRPEDQTSMGIKHLEGQNVRRDKMSGGSKRPKGQNVRKHTHKKHPEAQNDRRQHPFGLILIYSTYILKTSIIILY